MFANSKREAIAQVRVELSVIRTYVLGADSWTGHAGHISDDSGRRPSVANQQLINLVQQLINPGLVSRKAGSPRSR